jgi:hypothetical protein
MNAATAVRVRTRRTSGGTRTSAVPIRLRAYVSDDADLLADVLTHSSVLSLYSDRVAGFLTSREASQLVALLTRLYRDGVTSDEWVLGVAERFDRADRRGVR